MPILSRFYGIIIRMFFDEHAPPHFHAEYGEYELVVSIKQIHIMKGKAPKRVESMVIEWAALHQNELIADWELCQAQKKPQPIEPLE
ncbi:MAG: DUF4160 domain-containing protein [Proteobacteria bacterium]|nr:DUF4160 domain-containing protein [Pseudomonadota bacterium]